MRLLLVSVAAVVVLAGCRGWESEEPPVHLVQNMDTQEKGKAYRKDTTGLFADGRMMRAPVEGTVARGQLMDDDALELGLDDKGQPTLTFPARLKVGGKVPDALRAHGKERYDIFCAPCHGLDGDGKGPMTLPAKDGTRRLIVPPPAFHDPRLKELPVGKLYAAIKLGVNNGNMASYASQIPVDDRWAVVAWVRELQRKQDSSVKDEGGEVVVVEAASASSAEHGAQLYKAKGCNACHSIDGSKLVGPTFKGAYGSTESTSAGDLTVDDAYLLESMTAPMAKLVTGYPPVMPPQPLTDVELGSLVLYIQSLK